jgi:hypothetical protein
LNFTAQAIVVPPFVDTTYVKGIKFFLFHDDDYVPIRTSEWISATPLGVHDGNAVFSAGWSYQVGSNVSDEGLYFLKIEIGCDYLLTGTQESRASSTTVEQKTRLSLGGLKEIILGFLTGFQVEAKSTSIALQILRPTGAKTLQLGTYLTPPDLPVPKDCTELYFQVLGPDY